MTDTNKPNTNLLLKPTNLVDNEKKETFESYWESNFKNIVNLTDKKPITIFDLKKIKQLHDESIQYEVEKAFKDDDLINNWINEKIKEKDKQIAELLKRNKEYDIFNTEYQKIIDELGEYHTAKGCYDKIKELQAEIQRLKDIIKMYQENEE